MLENVFFHARSAAQTMQCWNAEVTPFGTVSTKCWQKRTLKEDDGTEVEVLHHVLEDCTLWQPLQARDGLKKTDVDAQAPAPVPAEKSAKEKLAEAELELESAKQSLEAITADMTATYEDNAKTKFGVTLQLTPEAAAALGGARIFVDVDSTETDRDAVACSVTATGAAFGMVESAEKDAAADTLEVKVARDGAGNDLPELSIPFVSITVNEKKVAAEPTAMTLVLGEGQTRCTSAGAPRPALLLINLSLRLFAC